MIAFEAATVVGWLATYAIHSTLLLGGALLLGRLLPSDAWRETAWKTALVGGLLTASAQAAGGVDPLAGQWPLPIAGTIAAADGGPAPSAPDDASPSPLREGLAAARPGTEEAAAAGSRAAEPGAYDGAAAAGRGSDPSGASAVGPGARRPSGAETGAGSVPAGSVFASALLSAPALAWALLLAWAGGAAFLLMRLARRHRRLAALLRSRRIVREPRTLRLLAELQRTAGVWRPVRLTASAACATPLALGAREICVPERLLDLDEEQQRSALAHELAHVARRDPHWHLAASVLEAVFFFQPLNRAARLRLREAAEHLADDWAVRHTGSPLGLARCLAEVASWVGSGEAVPEGTLAMAEGGSPLLRRVERLLSGEPGAESHGAGGRLAAAALLVALVGAAAPAVIPAAAAFDAQASPEPAGGPGESRWEEPSSPATGVPWTAPAPDGTTRAAWVQEGVVAHPDPSAPLAQKWGWAEREAERRGDAERWVAWSIERPLQAGTYTVEDSHGWHTDEFRQPSLGRLLFGPAFEAPARGAGLVRQPIVVMLRVDDGRIVRVAARPAALGMDLDGRTIYWLGATAQAQSIDWLQARLDDLPGERLQATAVEIVALHEDSERLVPWLEGIVASDRPYAVREDALEGLEWHPTPRAVAFLRDVALGTAEIELRAEAAETLAELPGGAAEAALLEVVRSGADLAVREEAVEGLAERAGPAVTAELLRLALEDSSPEIQEEAVEALAERPAAEAAPLLERLARTHPDPRIQEEAVESLADVDPARALATLEALLADASVAVELREEALDALADLRTPRAREVIFRAAMEDPSAHIQMEAAEALADFGMDAAPLLERLIWEHPNSAVRAEATEAVTDLPAERAAAMLDRIISGHEDARVLHEAVDALEDLPEALALPILLRAAREHPRSDVRQEAREKLGEEVKRRRP